MYSLLIKHILFPFHERLLGRQTLACLQELEKVQWDPLEKIRQYQWQKLKALLNHAYKNVAFYQKRFKQIGATPEDIKSFKDFAKLPFLTKKDIRENFLDICARNLSKKDFIRMNTGGSTGEPLIFYVDRRRISYDRAAHLRARRWWGIDIGEKEIVLWGSPVELSTQDKLKDIRDWLFNTRLLSAFKMSKTMMFKYAKIIKKYRPKHIFGYPSSIYLFSQFLEKHNIDLSNIGIKVIFVTADMLYDFQRKAIQETFKCPVANGYGGRDSGFIAHECPARSMHITEDIYVEFISTNKPVEPGERGEIIVTHLDNYAMPFIRYRTGDVASPEHKTCTCGRGSPLMSNIEGRTTDFIITPNGKIMHALSLIYILRDLEGIEAFKITQKKKDYLIIKIVKNQKFTAETQSKIKDEIIKTMESPVHIEIQFVNEIEPEKSGKYRYVISEVPVNL